MKKDDNVYLRHILDAIELIEEYNVNFAIVWDTVQEDLPVLQKTIKSVLK